MKKIYSGKSGYSKKKIYYEIKNGEFTIMEVSKTTSLKALFRGKSKIIYHLEKEDTNKLLSLISENDIKNTFGSEDGFLSFKDFCTKNKIDFKCIMNMD